MEKRLIHNYRGVRPATLVSIKEGDGTPENPAHIVDYVTVFEEVAGLMRERTLGKVVPLTEEEKSWLNSQSV